MNSTFIYTFRTNKYLQEFKDARIEVFLFAKLKDDFVKFKKLVEKTRPKHIIGLADTKTQTRFEKLALNAFNTGQINKIGKDSYILHVPPKAIFPTSKKPTKSFCNWTMHKISEAVDHKLKKISFIHFNSRDLEKLIGYIKSL